MIHFKNIVLKIKYFFRRRLYIIYTTILLCAIFNIYLIFKIILHKPIDIKENKFEIIRKDHLLSFETISEIFNYLRKYNCLNIKSQYKYESLPKKYFDNKKYEISIMDINIDYIGKYLDCIDILNSMHYEGILWKNISLKLIYPSIAELKCEMSIIFNGLNKTKMKFSHIPIDIKDTTENIPINIKMYKQNIQLITHSKYKSYITIKGKQFAQNDILNNLYLVYIDNLFVIWKDQKNQYLYSIIGC